jgi:hypothetical protein
MKHRIEVTHAVALVMFALASGCSTSPTGGSAPAGSPAPSGGATGQWVSVAKADAQEAFADPASVTIAGNLVELRAKQNFANPQPAAKKDRTYLSSQSTYRVDCTGRKVAYKDIQAFAAADLQGEVVQKATFYEKNLQWMDAPRGTVFGELLDYACEHAPASLPAQPPG